MLCLKDVLSVKKVFISLENPFNLWVRPLKGTNQAMKNRRMLLQTVVLIIISFIFSTLISVNSLTTVIDGNNEEMSKVLASNIYMIPLII